MSFFTFFGDVKSPSTNSKTLAAEEKLLGNSTIVSLDSTQDGSVIVQGGINATNTYYGVQAQLVNVKMLVEEYLAMAEQGEIEEAVDIIINDVVTCREDESPVTVNLEQVELSDAVKQAITDEFRTVLQLLDFQETSYEKVKRWYVEGRQAFQVVVDEKNPRNGIQKLIQLDSRCIRPVTIIQKEVRDGIEVIKSTTKKYYYNPNNQRNTMTGASYDNFQANSQELTYDQDSVVYVDSGLTPLQNGIVPGYLNKAVRPLNNLVTVEDATVIYAITRAPEKRAFYLDVGSLPKKSAEEYMKAMMNKFKTQVIYDRSTGKINTSSSMMGIVEDYWMPRRDGTNASSIETLQGGQQLGEMDHVLYFLEKLYKSLKIPKSRISGDGQINIGGSDMGEITRDEYRFAKFCTRLRRRYSIILKEILRRQLVLRKIVTEEDWNTKLEGFIQFDYTADNYIKEQQENEMLSSRMGTLSVVEPYIGQLFSIEYAQRQILRMSEEDIALEQERIAQEKKDGKYPAVDPSSGLPSDTSPLKYRPDVVPQPGGIPEDNQ